MQFIIWAGAIGLLGVGGWLYWCWRRRRRIRLIALVALLREPATFDPTVLAKTAGKAWNADLGDGHDRGKDGFVAGIGAMNTIMYDDRMFLINCIPRPYMDDPAAAAEAIIDQRLRQPFHEHKAWFSCDAMGVDDTATDEEIADWYRRLAKLFVEFLDDNCLLIYVPDTQRAYAINDETEQALLSADPLAAFQDTLTVPVIEVSADDPLMQEAVAKARDRLPEFIAAFERSAGQDFSIKSPVSHSGNTEFIWLTVTALEGEQAYGTLANDPADLGPLKLGSKVKVPLADLNDWFFVDPQGNLQGGFTIAAVHEAARRRQKRGS
jgi:uncharacterized protein YegJ (DUF2314 family)